MFDITSQSYGKFNIQNLVKLVLIIIIKNVYVQY